MVVTTLVVAARSFPHVAQLRGLRFLCSAHRNVVDPNYEIFSF